MRLLAVCSGQGSQYPGMGRELRAASAAARRVYECAADLLGYDLAALCEEAGEEALARTGMAQPAIFAHSLAALAAFDEAAGGRFWFAAAAGHSLGEYAALCRAGCFAMEDGFRIIKARAAVMDEAPAGAMIAVSGDAAAVEAVCARYEQLWAANYNHPAQTVLSGGEASCLAAAAELAAAGARVTRLAVGSAFHTPLMAPAAARFRAMIGHYSFAPPQISFYSNLTGDILAPGDIPAYFADHMTSPVLFTKQMAACARDGIDTCVEFGPRRVAATLAKKNIKTLTALNIEDAAGLEKTLAALGQLGYTS